MTNEKSKQAWHQLGNSILLSDCRFSSSSQRGSHSGNDRQNACGHGYRQQDHTHLTDRGQAVVGVAMGRL